MLLTLFKVIWINDTIYTGKSIAKRGDQNMLKEQVHIAVPTAFHPDESLHIKGTIAHIKNLYSQGIKSILVSGTTGEQHSLTLREKFELIQALEQEEKLLNEMEVIFGVASVRQKEAEELAERIRETKLAGIMLGFPPYVVPTQEEVIIYSESVIEKSRKPVILYNNPKRTGFDLAGESIIKLSKHESVVGIKDAGNQGKMERIRQEIGQEDFYFYAGGEVELEEKVAYGYNRLSSIAGNVAPLEICQWFQKLLANEELVEQETRKIDAIQKQVYQGNAILNVKKLLNEKGIPMGICRSPIGNG